MPVLDLGSTPVANALLDASDDVAPRFPLEVGFCPACALVQLLHVLPRDAIFGVDYPYFSSYSDVLDAHSVRTSTPSGHRDGSATARSSSKWPATTATSSGTSWGRAPVCWA